MQDARQDRKKRRAHRIEMIGVRESERERDE